MKSFEKSRAVDKTKCQVGSVAKWAVLFIVLIGLANFALLYIKPVNLRSDDDIGMVLVVLALGGADGWTNPRFLILVRLG